MTKVSIVVPCFNAQDYIMDAIASVQAQTHENWECIVVDDCSTDQSAQLVAAAVTRDPRVRLIRLAENQGASAARNAALDAATGDWVTLLDADDLYEKERLGRLLSVADEQDADLVFDNQIISDFPSSKEVDRAFHWLDEDALKYSTDDFFQLSAQFGSSLNPGYMKPLFRREFIEKWRLRYDPHFRSGQDYLFYANAFASNPRSFGTRYAGYIYRRRKGSLSRAGGHHLRNHAKLSDEILRRHGASLSQAVHGALNRRRRYYLQYAALNDLRVALSSRAYASGLNIIIREPGALIAAASAARRYIATKKRGAL